jgi:hypothetical protein
MASNIYSDCWRVKIIGLPATISYDQLAETFNLSKSRIIIPKRQMLPTYFAWIAGFVSEKGARDFVNEWSGSSIFGTTIKCNVLGPESPKPTVQHPQLKAESSRPPEPSKLLHDSRQFKG